MKYLATYGTLKSGHKRHDIIEPHVMFVAEVWMPGSLYNYKNMFPAWDLNGDGAILAELYEITGDVEPLLERLDEVEGHPYLFERQFFEVQAEIGEIDNGNDGMEWVEAYMYRGRAPSLFDEPIIPNGIWTLEMEQG